MRRVQGEGAGGGCGGQRQLEAGWGRGDVRRVGKAMQQVVGGRCVVVQAGRWLGLGKGVVG